MKFTLHPSAITARLVGQEVEVYDFPDGRLEIRWKGLPLPYGVFDKRQRVSHAAIVENKRLGEVLAWIKERQDAQPAPSGDRVGPRRSSQKSGLMKDWASPLGGALPHFWWKGISPRAVIPLQANAVLGSPASCCQFAIGAARKIDKGAALQDVAAPRWP